MALSPPLGERGRESSWSLFALVNGCRIALVNALNFERVKYKAGQRKKLYALHVAHT